MKEKHKHNKVCLGDMGCTEGTAYTTFILNEYKSRHGLTEQVMVALTDWMNKHFPDIEDSLKTNSK